MLFSSLAWVMCRRGAAQLAQVPGSSMVLVLDPKRPGDMKMCHNMKIRKKKDGVIVGVNGVCA